MLFNRLNTISIIRTSPLLKTCPSQKVEREVRKTENPAKVGWAFPPYKLTCEGPLQG